MRKIGFILLIGFLTHCASRQDRVYPDNGKLWYFDIAAGKAGGSVDTTSVEMSYRGPLTDTVQVIQLVEASASYSAGGGKAAFVGLQKQAQDLGAEGIYDVQFDADSTQVKASGYAFKFRR